MLRRTAMIGVLFGLGILLLLPMNKSEAQVSTGTIGGTVRDSTAAAVPGAQVVARAMQKYGMLLSDGGNIALTFARGTNRNVGPDVLEHDDPVGVFLIDCRV